MLSLCIAQQPFDHAVSLAGERVCMFDQKLLFSNYWYPKGCPVMDTGDWPPKEGATPHFSRKTRNLPPGVKKEPKAIIEITCPEGQMPSRKATDAAGADVFAAAYVRIPSKGHGIVPLGFKLTAPEGTYARLAPRSGLAATKMIDIGAGVIDRDYQGECSVIMFNLGWGA